MEEFLEEAEEAVVDDEGLTEDTDSDNDNESRSDARGADSKSLLSNEDIAMMMEASSAPRAGKNAKAVECLDLEGNVVGVYQSGISAVHALNIPQGDISLCCRGLKDSVNGYRFRFVGEEDRAAVKSRRSLMLGEDGEFARMPVTRQSRNRPEGERRIYSKHTVLAPAHIKVRKWSLVAKAVGSGGGRFVVKQWVPERDKPTAELRTFQTKKQLKRKKKSLGRFGVQNYSN